MSGTAPSSEQKGTDYNFNPMTPFYEDNRRLRKKVKKESKREWIYIYITDSLCCALEINTTL